MSLIILSIPVVMEFGTLFFKQILRVGDNIWPICHKFEMETR